MNTKQDPIVDYSRLTMRHLESLCILDFQKVTQRNGTQWLSPRSIDVELRSRGMGFLLGSSVFFMASELEEMGLIEFRYERSPDSTSKRLMYRITSLGSASIEPGVDYIHARRKLGLIGRVRQLIFGAKT